jgi:uncharacterized protein YuzE
MKVSYDPKYNIAYISLKKKKGKVRTITASDDVNLDIATDGTIYGIELLNANTQLSVRKKRISVKVENRMSGETTEAAVAV